MIGQVKVNLAAENQDIPLKRIVQFRGSQSSLQICNVPDLVGRWKIKGVSVKASYPDNRIISKNTTKAQDSYVVTLPDCDVLGNGKYQVNAEVVTETGEVEDDFILGLGDLIICDADMRPWHEDTKWRMNLVDSLSCEMKGDFYADETSACIYDGSRWINIKTKIPSLSGYATKNELSQLSVAIENDIPTNTSQLVNDSGYLSSHQSLSAYYTKVQTESIISDSIAPSAMIKEPDSLSILDEQTSYDGSVPLSDYVMILKKKDDNTYEPVNCFDYGQMRVMPIENFDEYSDAQYYAVSRETESSPWIMSAYYAGNFDGEFEFQSPESLTANPSVVFNDNYQSKLSCWFEAAEPYVKRYPNQIQRLIGFEETLLSGETIAGKQFQFWILTHG